MGQALPIIQALGTVVSTVQQMSAAKAQGNAEAARLEFEQRQLDSAARDELIAAKQEEVVQRRNLNDTLASIEALRASRGLQITSPTGNVITRDIKSSASADIRTNKINRMARADSLRQQGTYAGSLANFSKQQANQKAFGALIEGGTSLFTQYSDYKYKKSLVG